MPRRPAALRFAGIAEIEDDPHVVVDGGARPGTVLCLSHWPGTPTPRRLWRDLSVEIALAHLARPHRSARKAQAVTNDHFDEDGLASVFALAYPELAFERSQALVEFARVGDFGVVTDEAALKSQLVLETLRDDLDEQDDIKDSAVYYEELLPRLKEVLDHPEHFAHRVVEAVSSYHRDLSALRSGEIALTEDEELDLAVVAVARSEDPRYPLGHGASIPLVPAALHSTTRAPRVLVVEEGRYTYYDRYETWVRYCSRRLPFRRDLTELARVLSALESPDARWSADPPTQLIPVLTSPASTKSQLEPTVVIEALRTALRDGAPAFDPFSGRRGPRQKRGTGWQRQWRRSRVKG